jgi:hypothetical protein
MRKWIPKALASACVLAAVIAGILLFGPEVSAQTQGAAGKSQAPPPRVAGGRPDLGGLWAFATVTPLQRPKEFEGREVLSQEEAANLEQRAVRDQFVDRKPPPGNPGAYNRFWIDAGTRVVGTNRTSLIVDPPDGRVPALTPEGKAREQALRARADLAAGPEDLTSWDRCIAGFNAGPPIIPSGYNNNILFVQTSDYVVVLTEMVHDARVVPLDGRPGLPSSIRQWRGDSRGRWEGDTLVIETKNFRSEGTGTLPLRGLGLTGSENLLLTERFRRLDRDTLEYQFTMNDPTVWTRPWTVSTTMRKTGEQLYEYACHEGNYGLSGILGGARAGEKASGDAVKKTGSN